jgi:hypothetical protein
VQVGEKGNPLFRERRMVDDAATGRRREARIRNDSGGIHFGGVHEIEIGENKGTDWRFSSRKDLLIRSQKTGPFLVRVFRV